MFGLFILTVGFLFVFIRNRNHDLCSRKREPKLVWALNIQRALLNSSSEILLLCKALGVENALHFNKLKNKAI